LELCFISVNKGVKQPKLSSKLSVAVCVKINVKANSSESIKFSLVWNMPKVSFRNPKNVYTRYYTKFFEQNEETSQRIACYGFGKYSNWKNLIDEWRKPILNNS
jgi:non-lysosomal glucosylceramidase